MYSMASKPLFLSANCNRAMATHTHTRTHYCIIFFSLSLSSVLSWLLDTKAPQGRCWPRLSGITPTSVYNTTTSAESLPQGICLAQQLCMQKSLFTDRQCITKVNNRTEINKQLDDNPACYLWKHILWFWKWKHNSIYRGFRHLSFANTLLSFLYVLKRLNIHPCKIIG